MAISNKEKNFISVVIYVRNSAERMRSFLKGMEQVFTDNFNKYEIILVDDASEDESVAVIREAAADLQSGTVQIVHMSYCQGCELAMNAGVELAIGDFVYEFDSTIMDYKPEAVMQIYHRALEGYDIVSAAAKGAGNCASQFFYRVYNRFSQNANELRTERFRILSRRAINRIHSMSRTIPYRKALYANCGLPQDTVFYTPEAGRQAMASKQEYRWQTAVDALVLFTDIGYKTALVLTLGMVLFSLLVAVYAVFIFMERQPIIGWTSMILLVSVGFAGLFAVAAIIIKYLDVLLGLVFKRKNYTIAGIEKLTK